MFGKVARCRAGVVGLITHWEIDGDAPILYHGICLESGDAGKRWYSNDPELIGTIDDWVKLRYIEILEEEEIAAEGVFHSTFNYPTRRDLT